MHVPLIILHKLSVIQTSTFSPRLSFKQYVSPEHGISLQGMPDSSFTQRWTDTEDQGTARHAGRSSTCISDITQQLHAFAEVALA